MDELQTLGLSDDTKSTEPAHRIEARLKLERAFLTGANWFFWLAALSVINSVIVLAGGHIRFIFGLGITQVVDAFFLGVGQGSPDIAGVAGLVGLLISLAFSTAFAGLGWLARKRLVWPFVVGISFYLLDALVLLLLSDILSTLFHCWVLFALYSGCQALREFRRTETAAAALVGA